MTAAAYSDWLARGRKHQTEGRPADALSCYRRAAREDARGVQARFHLGEALAQLGLPDDAVGAWRDALRIDPAYLPALMTLAEAALTRGDFVDAAGMAGAALAHAPNHPRVRATAAIAATAANDASRLAILADIVAAEPAVAHLPGFAAALSAAPLEALTTAQKEAFLSAIARHVRTLPAPVLAALVERGGSLPANWGERAWSVADAGALRRVAVALHGRDAAQSRMAADHYAKVVSSAAPTLPLRWPKRTKGEGLRIGWLVAPAIGATEFLAAQTTIAEVARALPDATSEHTFITLGDATELRNKLADVVAGTRHWLEVPPGADITTSNLVPALDLDVLVDLAGLAGDFGPLIATRPARLHIAHEAAGAFAPIPLVDRTTASDQELIALLHAQLAALAPAVDSMVDATELAALWDAAVRAHQAGDLEQASEMYQRVLVLQPDYAPAHRFMGALHRGRGNADEALPSLARVLALAPDFSEARISLAELEVARYRADAAVDLLRDGLSRRPQDAELLRALGHAELAQGDGVAAAAAFVAALERAPTHGETHYNHGVALQMQGAFGEAARAYQRALLFRPDLVAADFNLGVLFRQQGRPDAAIAAFSHVLSVDPTNVAAWRIRGELLFAAGRIDEWREDFRRFERSCPKSLPMAVHALAACQCLGDVAGVDRYLEGLRNDEFSAADEAELVDALEEMLFLLLNFDIEPEMFARFYRTYDAAAPHIYGAPLPQRSSRRPGKLRIGYLSGDMRDHVMGKMMWQAIAHHDRDRFDLYFYATSPARDAWTDKFVGIATRFDDVSALGETAAAHRIALDDLDVLVDLSTHTKEAKPGILVRKPARVQITHVASCGMLGLSTIDFKLTDRYADVPENQLDQVEPLLAMDGCVYPYRHIEPARRHPFHRANFGLTADHVVIGAFVSLLKLSRRCLSLWREVLQRIPRARLAFSPNNAALRPLYEQVAVANGIPTDRLVFLPQGRDEAENQARYSIVDFTLDTMPYGGVNGTLEALDAGVPVVTLKGRRHGERSGYSILANLGVLDTVAESGREFVDIAVRLADDAAFAGRVRAAIHAALPASRLTDMPLHTRALEDAYIAALRHNAPDVLAATGIANAQ